MEKVIARHLIRLAMKVISQIYKKEIQGLVPKESTKDNMKVVLNQFLKSDDISYYKITLTKVETRDIIRYQNRTHPSKGKNGWALLFPDEVNTIKDCHSYMQDINFFQNNNNIPKKFLIDCKRDIEIIRSIYHEFNEDQYFKHTFFLKARDLRGSFQTLDGTHRLLAKQIDINAILCVSSSNNHPEFQRVDFYEKYLKNL